MDIHVEAIPGAKKEGVDKVLALDGTFKYIVEVKEPPVQGRANRAIIRVLAQYFKVDEGSVKITSGFTSRRKTIHIHGKD